MSAQAGWGDVDSFRAERAERLRLKDKGQRPSAQIIRMPGAATEHPLLATFERMSPEAQQDVIAYARCRLRRDGSTG